MKKISKLGLVLAVVYLIFCLIVMAQHYEGSWGGFFLYIGALPFSILSLQLLHDLNIYSNAVFVLVNTIWWYCLGWGISKLFHKLVSKYKKRA